MYAVLCYCKSIIYIHMLVPAHTYVEYVYVYMSIPVHAFSLINILMH